MNVAESKIFFYYVCKTGFHETSTLGPNALLTITEHIVFCDTIFLSKKNGFLLNSWSSECTRSERPLKNPARDFQPGVIE